MVDDHGANTRFAPTGPGQGMMRKKKKNKIGVGAILVIALDGWHAVNV